MKKKIQLLTSTRDAHNQEAHNNHSQFHAIQKQKSRCQSQLVATNQNNWKKIPTTHALYNFAKTSMKYTDTFSIESDKLTA